MGPTDYPKEIKKQHMTHDGLSSVSAGTKKNRCQRVHILYRALCCLPYLLFFFLIKPDITDTQETPEVNNFTCFCVPRNWTGDASSEQNNLISPVICCFNSE